MQSRNDAYDFELPSPARAAGTCCESSTGLFPSGANNNVLVTISMVNNRQFVVIAVGAAGSPAELITLALP